MFMRRNRAKNGAVQPEATASANASEQRKARKLSPNSALDGSPENWRFSPDMASQEKINDAHYDAGVSDEPYITDYERHIPFVGAPLVTSDGRKLREQ